MTIEATAVAAPPGAEIAPPANDTVPGEAQGQAANENEPEAKPKAAPASMEERLAKAEEAARRNKAKKNAERTRAAQLQQERDAAAKERDSHKSEAQKYSELLARAKDGDEAALAELLGEDYYDRITTARLAPDEVRKQRELSKTTSAAEERLKKLEEAETRRQEEAQARQVEQEQKYLVSVARRDDLREQLPELDVYSDDELVQMAPAAARALAEAGQTPTFLSVVRKVHEMVEPYHQKIIQAYEARKAKAAEASKAKAPPAPAPAPKGKEPKPKPEPSTVSAGDASEAGGTPGKLSAEERIAKAKARERELMRLK
jgi:hypothetical protein